MWWDGMGAMKVRFLLTPETEVVATGPLKLTEGSFSVTDPVAAVVLAAMTAPLSVLDCEPVREVRVKFRCLGRLQAHVHLAEPGEEFQG